MSCFFARFARLLVGGKAKYWPCIYLSRSVKFEKYDNRSGVDMLDIRKPAAGWAMKVARAVWRFSQKHVSAYFGPLYFLWGLGPLIEFSDSGLGVGGPSMVPDFES